MQINILHDICSQRMVQHAAVDTRKYNYITYNMKYFQTNIKRKLRFYNPTYNSIYQLSTYSIVFYNI